MKKMFPLFVAVLCVVPLFASTDSEMLSSLSRRFVETGAPAAREALLRFAAERKSAPEGALARLVLGVGDYQDKKFASALEHLALAAEPATELADYAVYYHALVNAATANHSTAARLLAGFQTRYPSSPLLAPALRQRAESLSLSGRAREALAILTTTPRTAGEWMLLAQVAERAGEPVRAAEAYQHVYYEFPTSAEHAQALAATKTLRASLGSRYPSVSPALRLARGDKLASAQQYTAARAEYRSLSISLKGPARELAAVRVAACDYNLRATTRAYKALKALKVTQPEAGAERLYYLSACARRLDYASELTELVAQLGRDHRESSWHQEALLGAANYYLLENLPDRYVAYYRTLFETFPRGPYAATAQWKVAWHAYLNRSGKETQARRLLEEHVRLFPASPQATAALYWLGRLAEGSSDRLAARTIYSHLTGNFPNYYHSMLAQERLDKLGTGSEGPPVPSLTALLAAVPVPAPPPSPEPSAELAPLLGRPRLLARLGLTDLADRELRFRAESGPLAYYAGLELAQRAADQGNYHQAIRFLKRYTPGYLAFPMSAMPHQYWELLFPLPWKQQIVSYSQMRELDPYVVAALIRQESEFNPGAISRARARGLMQILLPTGRRLGRNLGLSTVTVSQLHVPDTSLRLGTLHLRKVIDQYEGRLELALAGYNAGEHRVEKWLQLRPLTDPAEFVESIPFTETRTYVQAVLRNAGMYRKLYGS